MKWGVGVQGPSDYEFWNKVLHREFLGHRFDVRNMKTQQKLVLECPRLIQIFHGLDYDGCLFFVDADKDQCAGEVLRHFPQDAHPELKKSLTKRFAYLCIAFCKIESWYLADRDAIRKIIPKCKYEVPKETARLGAGEIRKLLQSAHGKNTTYKKPAFAQLVAPEFQPSRAVAHSKSFQFVWSRLTERFSTTP